MLSFDPVWFAEWNRHQRFETCSGPVELACFQNVELDLVVRVLQTQDRHRVLDRHVAQCAANLVLMILLKQIIFSVIGMVESFVQQIVHCLGTSVELARL